MAMKMVTMMSTKMKMTMMKVLELKFTDLHALLSDDEYF